jgi:uncharacterized protein (TIGR04255 family)
MQAPQHYGRAPISEAIIELRITPPVGCSVDALRDLFADERAAYPGCVDIVASAFEWEAGTRVSARAQQEQTGFRFTNGDGRQIAQVQLEGYSFSRLHPYESWEPFRNEARRIWEIYRARIHPGAITRVAVRYINHLDLPLPLRDFKDYLRTVPEVSQDLPQALSGYLMQLQIPQAEIGAHLILNQGLIQQNDSSRQLPPSFVSVLLDIDLFRIGDIPNDDVAIWEYLEVLHTKKNQVFEACITDRLRELLR